MKRVVYLAGAMEVYGSGDGAKKWREEVENYIEHLSNFRCINPVSYYSFDDNCAKTSAEIMRFDLRKVKEADIVLVNLNNIRKSLGTSDEILYAYLHGKPVIGFIDDDIEGEELANKIHTWKYEQIDRIETGEDSMIKACNYIINYYE